MTLNPFKRNSWLAICLLSLATVSYSSLRQRSEDSDQAPQASQGSAEQDANAPIATETDTATKLQEEAVPVEPEAAPKPVKAAPKRIDRADAFVAGPDWEFDGFVSGGQDSNVRSMFYLNDLIYLNIGAQQGIGTGDKIGIYKRGDKVKDPQTGKFIGYEVRRAAIAKATDRVEDETCAVRISNTYEAVEIGDLVRRE